jgi:uncharacterized delta-60 repeat protein
MRIFLIIPLFVTINIQFVSGQAGSLDLEFGDSGKVVTNLGFRFDEAEPMAIQSDGKIVLGGDSNNDFALVRYEVDGSLDESFGIGGIVRSDFENSFDRMSAMALQSDGKIVSAGDGGKHIFNFAVMRHNIDGSLDGDFGQDGKIITSIDSVSIYVEDLVIQNDGKIIVAGGAQNYGIGSDGDFAIIRYLTNGKIDSTFGYNGIVRTDISNHSEDNGKAITLLPNGEFIVAGYSDSNNGEDDNFAMVKYLPNGSIDNSFGINGRTSTDFNNSYDLPNAIAIQQDGKIVLAGYSEYPRRFAVARYNEDGILDQDFGEGGLVLISFDSGYNSAEAVAIDSKGNILVAGDSAQESYFDFSLARLKPNGNLDPEFGENGKVITDFNAQSASTAMALQQDGKIVLAGIAYNIEFDSIVNKNDTSLFALARYLPGTIVNNNEPPFWNGSISLFPNPVKENAFLSYCLGEEEYLSLELYDANGGLLKSYFKNRKHNVGNYTQQIDFPKELFPGTYFLRISTLQKQYSIKVFIIH